MLAEYVAEAIGALLGLFGLGLLGLYLRRVKLQRSGGTIDVSFHLREDVPGRGWVLGVGRFDGDELHWYKRVQPVVPAPSPDLSAGSDRLERREPRSEERRALPVGLVVLRCRSAQGEVELAMGASATTGFLAWLEATPPGATLPHEQPFPSSAGGRTRRACSGPADRVLDDQGFGSWLIRSASPRSTDGCSSARAVAVRCSALSARRPCC